MSLETGGNTANGAGTKANAEMRSVFENAPRRVIERRRGLDRRGKIGLALSVIGWLLWATGLFLIYFAFPQFETYFDKLYNKSPNLSWHPEFFAMSEALWAMGALTCAVSLYQFRKRYRRRTDKRHMGIMSALVLNVASIAVFTIFTAVRGL